jgi:hypothetical protein
MDRAGPHFARCTSRLVSFSQCLVVDKKNAAHVIENGAWELSCVHPALTRR